MSGNNLMGDGEKQQQEVTGEDALALLVGDSAKYKTVEEMAKAMVHGQLHISTLKTENAGLRDSASKATHMEEILKAINEDKIPGTDDNNSADQQMANTDTNEPVDLEALLEQKLNARDTASTEKSNQQKVTDALASKYGDRAAEMYRKAGKANGVDLDKLAATSPQAVINLVAGQPTSSSHQQSLPDGHTRVPSNNVVGNTMTKAAIDKRYANGEISRHVKTQLEFEGLESLGADAFWNR